MLRPPEPSVDVWRDNAGGVCAYAYSVNGRHCMDWPAIGRFCFDEPGDTVLAWAAPGVAAHAIERVHRRGVVPAALQRLGFETLHASGVRLRAGVVGFLGHAGAGKSTLARAFTAVAGVSPWADDTLIVALDDDETAAVPIPFDVGLRPSSARHFGEDASGVITATGGPAPLAALMMLERGSPSILATRLDARDAFECVLPHACTFSMNDADRRRQMVEHYLTLAAQVPVFRLAYPTDFGALPEVVDVVAGAVSRQVGVAR